MTLHFSTQWPDKMGDLSGLPTQFINKIWSGLAVNPQITFQPPMEKELIHINYFAECVERGYVNRKKPGEPKLHTIRRDQHRRWKAGMDIHPKIWTGKPRRSKTFQFAPIVKCTGVQEIEIKRIQTPHHKIAIGVYIDDEVLGYAFGQEGITQYDQPLKMLAMNDGFDSVQDFFSWFDTDFKGVVIHWTDLRY